MGHGASRWSPRGLSPPPPDELAAEEGTPLDELTEVETLAVPLEPIGAPLELPLGPVLEPTVEPREVDPMLPPEPTVLDDPPPEESLLRAAGDRPQPTANTAPSTAHDRRFILPPKCSA
jgi:hypothetical protein